MIYNDVHGCVHCDECDWHHPCRSTEEMEYRVQLHANERHGCVVLYRVNRETGKMTDVPEIGRAE